MACVWFETGKQIAAEPRSLVSCTPAQLGTAMDHAIHIILNPDKSKPLLMPEKCKVVMNTPFLGWTSVVPAVPLPPMPVGTGPG